MELILWYAISFLASVDSSHAFVPVSPTEVTLYLAMLSVYPELSWMPSLSDEVVWQMGSTRPGSFDACFYIITSKIIETINIFQQNKTPDSHILKLLIWGTRNDILK